MRISKRLLPTQPNILDLLDFCKGIAILWVVQFHFTKADANGFGWQGVHPFIVLSGFGLTYSHLMKKQMTSWKHWYLRRAERVLPVYWLVCILGFFFAVYLLSRDLLQDGSTIHLLIKSLRGFFLEVSFLKIFSYQSMWSLPGFDHLWFIPLIISFYLIFPCLYALISKRCQSIKGCLIVLLGALAANFLYRAIAIYGFDGIPIGYENALFQLLPVNPIDRLPANFPFQFQAPFGLFPARLGEFVLGMVGAFILACNAKKFHRLFSVPTMLFAALIWVVGCLLVYVGQFGWIFSDFAIALGLMLLFLNAAWLAQQKLPGVFSIMSWLGTWSYYIYLIHNFFPFLKNGLEGRLMRYQSILPNFFSPTYQEAIFALIVKTFTLLVVAAVILASSWLLRKFDQSKQPKWMVQNTLGRLLKIS